MAKEFKIQKQESKESSAPEMTLEEARAYRASLHKPEVAELTNEQKRDEFRKFWAQQKYQYGKSKDLEPILWAHLKASKQDSPEQFEAGLAHFGLKKLSN